MKLNHELLHKEIIIKLHKSNRYQAQLARELDFSPEVLQGVRKGSKIRLDNYLKIVEWLEKPMDYYIAKD